ncbi:MAG TPA: TolC family protein [Vicinamibacterales bacterium]|nr:TolC family protein [Vicinamibacterales bacterium]
MHRSIAAAIAILAITAAVDAQTQAPQAGGTGLTLAAALERALASNPAIAAARLQRPIDIAGVAVAGERPNPELAYELTRETPRQAITATLPIELGGKRDRRIGLANATVAVGDADLARVIAEVRNDVRRAYFEAVGADLRVQIAGDVHGLAMRARDAAKARVTAGDVAQSDLTQAELVLANGENDLAAARGEAAAARAELNALIGQPPSAPLVLADSLTGSVLPTAAEAIAQAAKVNGEVQVLDRRIAEQSARVGLAKSLRTPDISASSAFVYDAQPEFRFGWRVSFGVTIPVLTNHKAPVLFEDLTLARLRADRETVIARLGGAIEAALARAAAARDRVTRYESTILPLAVEAERQAQAAYNGGQTGLPALVQALQLARETRQRGLEAGLDYQRAVADLERAIGAVIK